MEMKDNYDVVIVGAGPAGLAAGIDLAKEDVNVLILDRKQEIGCPKRCAEGLGLGWFNRLELKPKKEWAVQPIHGAALYAPNGEGVQMKRKEVMGYVLERKMFEKDMAIQAAKAGAKILLKHQVISAKREDGEVILTVEADNQTRTVRTPLVVACDGVDSLTAKMLGLNTKLDLNETDAGYQYEMTGVSGYDEHLLHLYFGTDIAPRGYVWIFPKRNGTANVGIGIGAYEEKTAKYYLDKWISEQDGLANGSIIEVNAGAIPVGGFLDKMEADNLIVAGDAGHMVDPIHGGGIGIALEGGRLAAKHALKAIKSEKYSNEDLEAYTPDWYNTRGNELKKRLKGRHLLEQLKDDDFNYLAGSITMDEALKIGNGALTKKDKLLLLSKKLVTRPGLVKIFMKYMKDDSGMPKK
ncbi:MAG: NAD(P)/FAD-dependent oxidoreductase [Candidatus Diapherotrites archaeon]|jgi:digeranylgeranylglycerophospholipid reductase|uniref:NAD(P)/FAD-dependent oxidoreductase n=1 Tax=Candidatus Iainarchaeum sp. TaxID=3101447 RepID=A0A8T5GEX2_9ARCH|nr:NAD(P)/FAD-dependent oxidoreductase [Candidatus Diapherotrites archaeon]MBT7241337.1 NAD(P)/FAD-dependent oxidoreductase [Candidatus Diapherotrites archaeon]